MFKMMDLEKRAKVLDVGCGTGDVLRELANDFGMNLFGIEIGTERSRKKAETVNSKPVDIRSYDGNNVPFEDNFFDIVYTYHLLWHIPRKYQERIIKEMLRVTKKRGRIIFDILNKNFMWEKSKKYSAVP